MTGEKVDADTDCCKAKDIRLVGCCGAYCRTCRSFILGSCKGCKLGYDEGKRSLAKAKCKIKLCCFGVQRRETCAECQEYEDCRILADFHGKKPYEYQKYRESLDYIRAKGYGEFIRKAWGWRRAYGELEEPGPCDLPPEA